MHSLTDRSADVLEQVDPERLRRDGVVFTAERLGLRMAAVLYFDEIGRSPRPGILFTSGGEIATAKTRMLFRNWPRMAHFAPASFGGEVNT